MLKIEPNPTFETTVALSVPGKAGHEEIDVEYKWLSPEQYDEFQEWKKGRGDLEILSALIVSWKRVEVPYSTDALNKILVAYRPSGLEFWSAYVRELFAAKEKN